jgi:tryptophanyl-tRNA synthetase
MQAELAPIRKERAKWEQDIPAVYEILKKGSEDAREVAAETLAKVRAAMKIDYFDDAALIREQMEKYGQR